MNRNNPILNSEENLKLENRYSDSYFYKHPENDHEINQIKCDYNRENTKTLENSKLDFNYDRKYN